MQINNFSNCIIPIIVLIIIVWGLKEKIKIFDLFIEGAKEGIEVAVKLLPSLIGLFFAVGLLKNSGIFNAIAQVIKPICDACGVPAELTPLFFIRPISGSGAIAVATSIMNQYGVDSFIGRAASVIMGSTETTIYTYVIYTSGIKVNKSKDVLVAALIADVIGMLCAVVFCRI